MHDIDESDSFGALLRQRRIAAGLTQEDLASRSGMSARSIQNLERGENRPRSESLLLLADALRLNGQQRILFENAARPLPRGPRGDRIERAFRPVPGPRPNLPNRLVSFVGRTAELALLGDLLQRYRLMTLTGPGGVGKTSLALQTAVDHAGDFADGVFFVSLASLVDPDLVAPTLARALGAPNSPSRPAIDVIREVIRAKRVLFVIDNFEPVVDAAPLVSDLLSSCPGLSILITSRVVLRVQGEHVLEVNPLALPDLGSRTTPERMIDNAAVRLFVERAQSARASFRLTDANAATVAEICTRVEGLPLAIELAAAWTRLLSPAAILERMTPLLRLLSSTARDRPARHQTMGAAIGWSYDLLTEDDQAWFRRLCVFAGGFTLDAALAIGRPGNPGQVQLLGRIESLVDKSLLQLEVGDGESRLRILETIREYGWERLAERGELDAVRRDHATYFFGQVEGKVRDLYAPLGSTWLAKVEQERPNVRAALRWLVDSGDVLRASWLAAALGPFWHAHGPLSEGRARLGEVVALSEVLPLSDRTAESRLAEAHALHWLASLARRQSDYPAARRHYENSLAILRQVGDQQSLASSLLHLSNVEIQAGDLAAARRRVEEALAFVQETGDHPSRQHALAGLGLIALHEADYAGARICLEEVVDIARMVDDDYGRIYILHTLGCVALGQRRLAEARRHLREALALARDYDDKTAIANILEAESALEVANSSRERGVRLASAASALRAAIGVRRAPVWDRWFEPRFQPVRSALGPEAFARSWAEGQVMTPEQVMSDAPKEDSG